MANGVEAVVAPNSVSDAPSGIEDKQCQPQVGEEVPVLQQSSVIHEIHRSFCRTVEIARLRIYCN